MRGGRGFASKSGRFNRGRVVLERQTAEYDARLEALREAAGDGSDTITDFENGTDTIDLSAITSITGFSDLTITQVGDDTNIDLGDRSGCDGFRFYVMRFRAARPSLLGTPETQQP